ncbi:hypothetical protein F7Q99_07045 [Streptomyces kaniharaensis]|uniref:RNA polymerase sigma factor 70 region 4 type 2 domain-containing protein n=1 Tax=Streptomyces kaniharaensis TaxID=212423 RepID=A0A6N7KNN1_9ACTN|nr:sigma factor-like helix-turn-helix DNA-binding protein [Streptomyces kaniharaensis]MQS12058.1 hypothetical protein [Streptomyces kaniharaensis]
MPATTPPPARTSPHRPQRTGAAFLDPDFGLRALHDLNHDRYLRYAALLLPAAEAYQAIKAAYDELAERWPRVLAARSPAACAWQTVRRRVCALAGPHPLGSVSHLSETQQDVLVLHLVLDLPKAEVAALTGTDPATVHAHLRSLGSAAGHLA